MRRTMGHSSCAFRASMVTLYCVEVPISSEITRATPAEPFLNLLIELDPLTVARLAQKVYRYGLPRGDALSAPPRCLDGGNVDFLHRHHRFEGTPCLIAAGRERVGQHARGDLPGEAPAVLAPTALALLPPIVDDRVPVAVRLFLIVRRDLRSEERR